MDSLFKKLNTLVRAQIDSFLEDDLRLPRRQSSDRSADPTSPEAARLIIHLRRQIEESLTYEDDLEEKLDALQQDYSDLDRQANDALQAGQEDAARQVLSRLQQIEKQMAMLEADLVRHRQGTAQLMDQVNMLEGRVAQVRAAAQQAAAPREEPVENAADQLPERQTEPETPEIKTPEQKQGTPLVVKIPVKITPEAPQPTSEQETRLSPESGQRPAATTISAADDPDNLAARRARLARPGPDPEE